MNPSSPMLSKRSPASQRSSKLVRENQQYATKLEREVKGIEELKKLKKKTMDHQSQLFLAKWSPKLKNKQLQKIQSENQERKWHSQESLNTLTSSECDIVRSNSVGSTYKQKLHDPQDGSRNLTRQSRKSAKENEATESPNSIISHQRAPQFKDCSQFPEYVSQGEYSISSNMRVDDSSKMGHRQDIKTWLGLQHKQKKHK